MAAIGRRNLASIVLLSLVQELIARIALKAEQPSRTLSYGTGDLYRKTASRQSRSGGGGLERATCELPRREERRPTWMLIGIIMRMFMAYFASIRLRGIFAGSKSGGKYRFSTFLSPIVLNET